MWYPDTLCKYVGNGEACPDGNNCRYSHDLHHFDENWKPKKKKKKDSEDGTRPSKKETKGSPKGGRGLKGLGRGQNSFWERAEEGAESEWEEEEEEEEEEEDEGWGTDTLFENPFLSPMTIRTEDEALPGSCRIKPAGRRRGKKPSDGRGAASDSEAVGSDRRSSCSPGKEGKKSGGKQARVSKTALRALRDLPKNWWVVVPNHAPGYQFITELMIATHMCVTLLDTGAAFNAIAAEVLLRLIQWCEKHGIEPGKKDYPIEPG